MRAGVLQQIILPAVIVAAGLACIVYLSGLVAAVRPSLPEGYEDTDLIVTPTHARGFVCGTEGLMADVYFMRALQYIGRKILKTKSEDLNIDDLRSLNPRLL